MFLGELIEKMKLCNMYNESCWLSSCSVFLYFTDIGVNGYTVYEYVCMWMYLITVNMFFVYWGRQDFFILSAPFYFIFI